MQNRSVRGDIYREGSSSDPPYFHRSMQDSKPIPDHIRHEAVPVSHPPHSANPPPLVLVINLTPTLRTCPQRSRSCAGGAPRACGARRGRGKHAPRRRWVGGWGVADRA